MEIVFTTTIYQLFYRVLLKISFIFRLRSLKSLEVDIINKNKLKLRKVNKKFNSIIQKEVLEGVLEELSCINALTLITWQKIAPLVLIFYSIWIIPTGTIWKSISDQCHCKRHRIHINFKMSLTLSFEDY